MEMLCPAEHLEGSKDVWQALGARESELLHVKRSGAIQEEG
jgi:hypothetical protein